MKKITSLFLFLLLISCSSSDDDSQNLPEQFNSSLSVNKNTLNVDEPVTISISSNKNINEIQVSLDNFVTLSANKINNFGTSTNVYLSFDDIDEHTIYIKSYHYNGIDRNDDEIVINTIKVNVVRGNSIKINNIVVKSFSNINGKWDDEFSDTDINRLADVFFALIKQNLDPFNNVFKNNNVVWHESTVKENQGDLIWDISNQDLFLNPEIPLRIGLADEDGSVDADLLLGPPFDKEISFTEHINSKPSTVTLIDSSIDLEIEFTIEWP